VRYQCLTQDRLRGSHDVLLCSLLIDLLLPGFNDIARPTRSERDEDKTRLFGFGRKDDALLAEEAKVTFVGVGLDGGDGIDDLRGGGKG
jgi:hypothetical protein